MGIPFSQNEFKSALTLLVISRCQRTAEVGCYVRKGDLGAPGGSKAGRGCNLICKEYNPTVRKKEEHGRSSDINQGQTTLIDYWASPQE